jgi:limonene-1,2-epoxide hydrolase
MESEDVVGQFIAAVESKDVPAAVALAAPDISYENVPISPVKGRDALAATLQAYLAPAQGVEWRIIEQWVVGTTVINERLDRFQIGSGWLELPVAGIFKIDGNEQIALWRDYFDMTSYTEQFQALTAT